MSLFFTLLFALLPTLGLAATSVDFPMTFASLNPPATDVSVSLLGAAFGVFGVLHGTGSQIIGKMFGVFNSVILCFSGILWSYVALVGTINTASEGEFLGRKWSSMWIPCRIMIGAVLLVPKATTGYSFIQVLVMYIVVQGVGAADKVWNAALNYMENNGTIVEPVQSVRGGDGAADNSFLIDVSGKILKAETCMATLYNLLHNAGIKTPSILDSLKTTDSVNGKFIEFPSKPSNPDYSAQYTGFCGKVSWEYLYNPQKKDGFKEQLSTAAAERVVWSLLPLAQTLANVIIPPKTLTSSGTDQSIFPIDPHTQKDPRIPITPLPTSAKWDISLFSPSLLLNAASGYFAIIKPGLRTQIALTQQATLAESKKFIQSAKEDGWIMAGSHYYQLAKLNAAIRNLGSALKVDPNKVSAYFSPDYTRLDNEIPVGHRESIYSFKTKLPKDGGLFDNYIKNELDKEKTKDPNSNPNLFIKSAFPSFDSPSEEHKLIMTPIKFIGNFLGPLLDPFKLETSRFQNMMIEQLAQNKDPIVALATIGNSLVEAVENVWLGVTKATAAMMVAGIAVGFVSGFWTPGAAVNIALAVISLLFCFMPLLVSWMTVNFTVGATLAYYVPLIPFFIFFFGAISWLVFVIEAVLAAPLIALGITHPEGHDFLGKAEQAMMLLASVFLRPMLMIFGFIFGIILCTIAFGLFHYGYSIAIQAITDLNKDWLIVLSMTVTTGMYGAMSMLIVTMSFSAANTISNKVLRWVGGSPDNESAQALAQIESGVHRNAEQLGSQASQKVSADVSSKPIESFTASQKLGEEKSKARQNTSEISGKSTPPAPPKSEQQPEE